MPTDDVLDQPSWLRNPDWRENRIRSEARSGLRVAWLMAGMTLVPSAFIAAIVPGEVANGNNLILIALAFPLLASITTVSALRKSLEWRRFGLIAVVLDPFPGSLGGDVGGAIEVPIPFDPARRCDVTLACVGASVGQGEGASNRENVIWEREGLATARRSAGGTRLAFRFEVPADLPESEPESANYRRWMVRLHAPMRGTDLDRAFIVPVFETGGQRAQWRQADSHAELVEAAPAEPPRRLLRLGQEGAVTVLRYPPLRNPGATLGVAIFAVIFLGCGFFWLHVGGDFSMNSGIGAIVSLVFMGVIGVIFLVGGGLAAAALYMLGNSLVVRAGPEEIATVRRLFGVPISRQRLAAGHLLAIESEAGMRSGQGVRSRKYERLVAKGSGGQKIVIGDGIDDAATAELVRRAVAEACGLKGEAPPA